MRTGGQDAHRTGAEIHDRLLCPHCRGALSESPAPNRSGPGSLRCQVGHDFNIARQGYIDLTAAGGDRGTADTTAMVETRERVESDGVLAGPIEATAERLARELERSHGATPKPPLVIDSGAGTGALLAACLERVPGALGLALELSRPALRRAARADERITAVACDVWGAWPVRDDQAAAIINVFAPRNIAEMSRVLVPGGTLIVVTPASDHLAEIAAVLGMIGIEPGKAERLEREVGSHLELLDAVEVRGEVIVSREVAIALAEMGPSARHVGPESLRERAETLADRTTVTVATEIAVLRN